QDFLVFGGGGLDSHALVPCEQRQKCRTRNKEYRMSNEVFSVRYSLFLVRYYFLYAARASSRVSKMSRILCIRTSSQRALTSLVVRHSLRSPPAVWTLRSEPMMAPQPELSMNSTRPRSKRIFGLVATADVIWFLRSLLLLASR